MSKPTLYQRVCKVADKKGLTYERIAREALLIYEEDKDQVIVRRAVSFFSLYGVVRGTTFRKDLTPLVDQALKRLQ